MRFCCVGPHPSWKGVIQFVVVAESKSNISGIIYRKEEGK